MDITTIGTTISTALGAVAVIAAFLAPQQRRQRTENRKLRRLVVDFDAWSYQVERDYARRGRNPPPKPASLRALENHDDDPHLDLPEEPTIEPAREPTDAGPEPAGAGSGSGGGPRHALTERPPP